MEQNIYNLSNQIFISLGVFLRIKLDYYNKKKRIWQENILYRVRFRVMG